MEEIFYSNTDELSGRHFIIEEADGAIWTYLTIPNSLEISKRCFLGSRFNIKLDKFDTKKYKKKRMTPPMVKEFSTIFTNVANLNENDFLVVWYKNGNVLLLVKRIPFLFFFNEENLGYSKSIRKDSIYGNPWNADKYEKIKIA